MQARLLRAARECGRRWDEVNGKLESIIRRLTVFVSEWEEFEAEGEELALWLADLDVRLTEVDYLNGSTCEKLRRLQSFQQCVCENSSRVNALLQRGEALIQDSEPTDAQHVETRLLELLRRCSHIYNNIARTHTRLLSMRLVFEDDWILSQATDSGCPSETLLEEEGGLDKSNLDLPANSEDPGDCSQSVNPSHPPSAIHPSPPAPSSPTHDHQGLEWDPSVDIGRSVSCDDASSSYFSASTGVCHRDGLKRRSFLSSLDSQSDVGNDNLNHAADTQTEGFLDHDGVFSPAATRQERDLLPGDQWVTSTPDAQDSELVCFDGGRVRAWLGVQSLAFQERMSPCSKAVQTEGEVESYLVGGHVNKPTQSYLQHHHDDAHQPVPALGPSSSPDLQVYRCDGMNPRYPSNLQAEEESSFCEELERLVSEQSATSSSRAASSLLSPPLVYLLLAAALAVLACLIWVALEPPCHCSSSRMHRSFHLALRYINGPPPT
ncbi:SPEC and KASH domain-containing protein isoform X2 [Anabas testudineus]|nr:SPEC and KASH domain-containing protein isoform X2 [Anabas testudineus]